jgi:hypothetical protein
MTVTSFNFWLLTVTEADTQPSAARYQAMNRATPFQRLRCARALAAGLLGLAVVLISPGAFAVPVGFVTASEGIVEIQQSGDSNWEPAAIDSNISIGDTIGTERNSFVKVLLVDDTTLFVGEETELVIDKLVVGDMATKERSVLQQLRGQVRAHVGQAFGGTTRLEIHTPTAIVGVKGSTMEVRVRGPVGSRETLVKNVEGEMFVAGRDVAGNAVMIPRGLCSRIIEGRDPEPPMRCPTDFEPVREAMPSAVAQAKTDALILPGGVAAGGSAVVMDINPIVFDGTGGIAPQEPVYDSVAGGVLGASAPPEPPPVVVIVPIETPGDG